jgi:hypothetical protein
LHFCIRDDDTNFFTTPEDLEQAYGEITNWGPVSLAIIPFCRAGWNKAVPEKLRGRWSVHPLHENQVLVSWLRASIAQGRFEAMLHGYHHDDEQHEGEFAKGNDLLRKVSDGRKYLEDLLGAPIRVFVPPHNAIGREGLKAIALEGLHLGCTAGLRSGWSPLSPLTWTTWLRLRKWRVDGGLGIPWILDMGDHREIAGNCVTPASSLKENEARYDCARQMGGVFCAATHYWEFDCPSIQPDTPTVREHLQRLIERVLSDPGVIWRSVGEIVSARVSRNF